MSGVAVWVKREDLNHPIVQGNKLRKLKYNLIQAQQQNCRSLITFGGAFSNHLLAVAFAAKQHGFKSVGVVRGDELKNHPQKWSKTLNQAAKYGMQLHFISRSEYRKKQHSETFQKILSNTEQAYLLPEGGSNPLAVQGMAEMVDELLTQMPPPEAVFCPLGTGASCAGIICGLAAQEINCKVYATAVLKGLHSVKDDIKQWTKHIKNPPKWQILHNYHCGGYAKSNSNLRKFSTDFTAKHDIPLDKIYNAKSFFALQNLIDQHIIKPKQSIAIIHTGGLQGGVFESSIGESN